MLMLVKTRIGGGCIMTTLKEVRRFLQLSETPILSVSMKIG